MARLTPAQAYRLGFARGLSKARGELREMTKSFDDEVANLQERRLADLHRLKAKFDDEIASLQTEFAAVEALANVLRRDQINRAVQVAANERAMIPDTWLH